MLDPKTLEEIGNKMSTLLANSPAKDLEKNAKAAMSGLLAKLDVVTREEFDVQAHVLARTREKLKELEDKNKAMEKSTITLQKNIEDYKAKIKKAEEEIARLAKEQENGLINIENQRKAIEDVRRRKMNVESEGN